MTTPRPTSRAEQRRRTEARILDAATRAFFSAGYDRTTIRAVASAAGVDAGLVMHYFGSKQELYRRVIDAAPTPEIGGTPAEAAEQILASLADRLASEPVASLALLRSMLTNPEAASAASTGIARYEAQIAQAIPAADAGLRAAIISAVTLGIMVSRHLIKSDELATADSAQVIRLLRPCMLSLAARPDPSGRLTDPPLMGREPAVRQGGLIDRSPASDDIFTRSYNRRSSRHGKTAKVERAGCPPFLQRPPLRPFRRRSWRWFAVSVCKPPAEGRLPHHQYHLFSVRYLHTDPSRGLWRTTAPGLADSEVAVGKELLERVFIDG